MILRRVAASVVVGMLLLGTLPVALATDIEQTTEDLSIATEEEIDKVILPGVDDLAVQLNDLYKEVGKSLNIDYVYVKILHILADGKAVYPDKRPNIYSELTADSMSGPFDIAGATQSYSVMAPWALCPDETIERPNKYYIPDAAYSVTSEVVKLMNQRYYSDRGQMQSYFDALSKDVKTNVVFCEAVLEYIGSDSLTVESFYSNYEKILYEKDKDENVLESDGNGTFTIKDKFKAILKDNNISDERDLGVLSIILSFDGKLAASSNPDTVKDEYVLPYKSNYTSRENMMLAAMSVVGKVRYVWGGGHLDTGTIDGINPAWQAFTESYKDETGEVINSCIKPNGCWCPIHQTVESDNGCLMIADTVYSVEEYIDSRKEVIDTQNMEDEKFINLMNRDIDFSHGVNSHRLDGLDCSGYASWLYNQISDKRTYDCGARHFISAGNLQHIEYGSRMLPGDVFSWGSHIVVVVGPARADSNAYIITEASPNMVKFGVMYYSTASSSDRELAIKIATEANTLIGNLPLTEKTHIYNMDTRGFSEDEETGRYAEIGRLPYTYLDENIVISEYHKKIKDMDAKEIIQYTLDNIGNQYISGLSVYKGEVFDTSKLDTINIDMDIVYKNEEAKEAIVQNEEMTVEVLKLEVE